MYNRAARRVAAMMLSQRLQNAVQHQAAAAPLTRHPNTSRERFPLEYTPGLLLLKDEKPAETK